MYCDAQAERRFQTWYMINKETLEIVVAFQITGVSVGEASIFEDLLRNVLTVIEMDPDERRVMVLAQRSNQKDTPITHATDDRYDSNNICKKLNIIANT